MTSLKLRWGFIHQSKDDLAEILEWGWAVQRTPSRKSSLLFRNPSPESVGLTSIRVDNIPDEIIQQLLRRKREIQKMFVADGNQSRA
jgi:hypothetical protein